MTQDMTRGGHVLICDEGRLVSVDRGFCDIMQDEPKVLVGQLVSDVTAPADREECAVAIARLRDTLEPFRISKRFMRLDGSLVWVTNTVSIVENGSGGNVIVATIDPILETGSNRAPARLLDAARFMIDVKQDRAEICDGSLFPDTAWDAILSAYVAEAEGRAIDIPGLAAQLGIPISRAGRWIDVLLGQKVIEIETRAATPYAPKSFRLTAATHARLESHLSKVDLRAPRLVDLG